MKIDLRKSNSPFSKKEKFIRILWNICWGLVRYLPGFMTYTKIFILRMFGANIGNHCLIESGVKVWIPWNLIIEDFVAIGRDVEIYNYGIVHIKSMTIVSQYCYICTGTHDYTHPFMPLKWGDITIGEECWIAAGCWLLPNVKVGAGCVIGARSVVTKDMPAWMVCAGHPCKPIKPRVISE